MNLELKSWLKNGNFFEINNHKIFYKQIGSGEDLILLHGYPYSSYDWKLILNDLSKVYRVTLFDFLGMGFSDKPKNHQYSFNEYSNLVSEIAKKLEIKKARIFAHDLGVSVVQEMLTKEKNLGFEIHSIAYLNGGLFSDVYKPRLIQRILSQSPNFIGKFLSKKIKREKIEKSILGLFGKHTQPSKELLDDYWEILNFNEGKSISYLIGRLIFEKKFHQEKWISAMQKTKIPQCYIYGPSDPNSGTHMAKRFKEVLPNSKIYPLTEKISHWSQIEAPIEVIKSYFEFQKSF